MRLDAIAAPTVVGIGLSTIILHPQSSLVDGFPLSSFGSRRRPIAVSSNSARATSFLSTSSSTPYFYREISRLSATQSSDDDIIDAIVEEKTAGLALNEDEENSSVSTSVCYARCKSIKRLQFLSCIYVARTSSIRSILYSKAYSNTHITIQARVRKRDVFKKGLKGLASLSLIDYKWRSAVFKKNEADRMEEEWMARMMGEDPSYARPMDAGDERRGPLVS